MGFVILLVFPFMLMAEILKRNKYHYIYPAILGRGFRPLYNRPVMPIEKNFYILGYLFLPLPLCGIYGLPWA